MGYVLLRVLRATRSPRLQRGRKRHGRGRDHRALLRLAGDLLVVVPLTVGLRYGAAAAVSGRALRGAVASEMLVYPCIQPYFM